GSSTPTLKQVWETDTLLRTPESVLFDPEREVIYVANVNMNPWEKDGNGFLSKLDLAGNILELEWITGLSGPKGMGIRGNSLFVADIDEVVEVDLETATIVNHYVVADTPTLNDISVYQNEVYVTGSNSNKLFELKDGALSIVLEGDLGRPNGVFAEGDRILMITSNSSELKSIDKASKEQTFLVDSLGHGDGIVPVGNGDYLASSWRGEVFHISSDWKRTQLLDTQEANINAADIEYIQEQNLLLVPTFFDNRVVAYRVEK
ncbi:MAG: gluconolaconase, partial [Bacteroidota bacterium]